MKSEFDFSEICCVVVTYNGNAQVISNIKKYSSFLEKIIVIDNFSTNGFRNDLICLEENVKIIFNDVNQGIAYALNQGLEYGKAIGAKFLLTMDQDSYIDEKAIKIMLESINFEKNCISVGPNYEHTQLREDKCVNFLITSGNLTYIDAAIEVGGYSEGLFIDEVDIDFSFALRKHGYILKKIANASMEHKIGEVECSKIFKIKYLSHSPIRFYYMYRNTLWVFKNYYNVFFVECLKMLLALIFLDTTKLLLIEKNKTEKIKEAMRGIKDGLFKKNE